MLKIKETYKLVLKVFMAFAPIAMTVSCWDEVHPGTYYTFTGQTLADYLEQDSAQRFSSFIVLLLPIWHSANILSPEISAVLIPLPGISVTQ